MTGLWIFCAAQFLINIILFAAIRDLRKAFKTTGAGLVTVSQVAARRVGAIEKHLGIPNAAKGWTPPGPSVERKR